MTYGEVLDTLEVYAEKAHVLLGDDLSLSRMWPMLEKLDNPQLKLKAVHIAGTSGKTSTAYFCSALLVNAGFTVGMTVSPHVDTIRERIQINNEPIHEDEFAEAFTGFFHKLDETREGVSYFELLVAFELWYFAERGVDYAVIETGMGGLLDATNVLRTRDKVCVITDIGFDHMHVLGNTLPAIASQKAGIIHAGNTVFMYEQDPEIMNVIQARADEQHAKLVKISEDTEQKTSWTRFQARNYRLARETISYLAKRDTFDRKDLEHEITVPGRMEICRVSENMVLVMDGAHNEQKMNVFVESFIEKFGHQKVPILLALKKGKEYKDIIKALRPIMSECIVTSFTLLQNESVRSQDPRTIAKYCLELGIHVTSINDYRLAHETLLSRRTSIAVATGSFYLLSKIRQILR